MKKYLQSIQLAAAVLVLLTGLALLFIGIFCPPKGEIHNSVLIAWGESLTFVGSIFGIDYSYRYRSKKLDKDQDKEEKE